MTPRRLMLLVVLCALNLGPAHANPADPYQAVLAGQRLNAADVQALETTVAQQPEDLTARAKLLGYYFMRQYSSAEAKAARRQHILWIIQHHPEAAVAGLPYCSLNPIMQAEAYQQGKQLWLKQTRAWATNTAVLGHAAQFFLLSDKPVAQGLLEQAQTAEPGNPQWPDRLGHLYALGKADAAKSLAAFERAQATDPDAASRFARLDYLAAEAYATGDLKKAARYARELLAPQPAKNWNDGNAILVGNTVLGRIALQQGQLQSAKDYLLQAGHTPGSPQLDSFGPNLSLAKELLEKGETNAVLQYLELCRKFWRMGAGRLDQWTREIQAGHTPDFGANLNY